jgi:flagellar hook-basal body complex protein FliE
VNVPVSSVAPVAPASYLPPVEAPQPAGGDFGGSLAGAVDDLQGLQSNSDRLAVKAVTGDLTDIHDATIAAARASVTLQLVSAVRNKGVDAFTEIMRMQA